MEDIISATKAELVRAKDRIKRDLAATPDDKINWSPSAAARTPLQQAAHAAMSIGGMQGMFEGKPFPFESMADMDRKLRIMEKEYTTRESVNDLLESDTAAYCTWLDTITPEQLSGMFSFPAMQIPMAVAITLPADHIRSHASQLEYIQTIYGDYEMHAM